MNVNSGICSVWTQAIEGSIRILETPSALPNSRLRVDILNSRLLIDGKQQRCVFKCIAPALEEFKWMEGLQKSSCFPYVSYW